MHSRRYASVSPLYICMLLDLNQIRHAQIYVVCIHYDMPLQTYSIKLHISKATMVSVTEIIALQKLFSDVSFA